MVILANRFSSAQIEKLAMAAIAYQGCVNFSRETFSLPPARLSGPIDDIFDYEIHCVLDEDDLIYNTTVLIIGPLFAEYFTIEEVLFAADTRIIGEKLVDFAMGK